MSAIDQYLADLDDELRVRLWRRERILAEVRGHLEQSASEAKEQEEMTQAQAEQRAVAAFGSPEQVAKGFAADAGGALNRTVVAVSDLSYRVARNPSALGAIGWWPLALVALASVGVSAGFLWMLACSWGGLIVFYGFTELKPAPRPGYARRWRKLGSEARSEIAQTLRGGKAPSQPPTSDFALEVRQRVRSLRGYGLLIVVPFLTALVALTVVAQVAIEELHLAVNAGIVGGVVVAASLVAGVAVGRWDRRSARRQVEAELAALEVVEDVAGEALRDGSARLQERFEPLKERHDGTQLWFELVPENPEACPVSLAVGKRALHLRLGPDRVWHSIERRNRDCLRELRLYLSGIVSGGYR